MARATRKVSKTKKSKAGSVLKVDSPVKVKTLESLLKKGGITIVLVYADWCGHCHRFQKDLWNPACKKPAAHNRVALNEKVLPETSLKDVNISHYPSVLLVENGRAKEFKDENGEPTNAIPTPRSEAELEKLSNMDLTPLNNNTKNNMNNMNNTSDEILIEENLSMNNGQQITPSGTSYDPNTTVEPVSSATPNSMNSPSLSETTTEAAAQSRMVGGALLQALQQVGQGIYPLSTLKGLSTVLKGGRRRKSMKKRSTHKRRRMIKA